MRRSSRRSKKLSPHPEGALGGGAGRHADRDLVPRRSPDRPEERLGAAMGKARYATASARRSTLQERLLVWRHLPGARHWRRACPAARRHRGHAASSRRDQPQRRKGRPCSAAPGSSRMAHNGKARRPYEYHADLPALTRPRVEPRREPLAVPTRQLALKSRLRDLRRHHRRRLPSLDEHPRQTRNHHLHRHARLGSRRSIVMTAGIITTIGTHPNVPVEYAQRRGYRGGYRGGSYGRVGYRGGRAVAYRGY